jgi:hypothetical protein
MTVTDNLAALQKSLKAACKDAGRKAEDVALMAVSKMQPEERVEEALAAGQRLFGENRVQDALERWQERRKAYPDLRLHLIGSLQSNKAKEAVALFDCIESVDRPSLVSELAKEMKAQNRNLPCLIQVNTGEEDQKGGVLPKDLPALVELCRKEGLNITGLMCIPPHDVHPGLHFALLRKFATTYGFKTLSMGMSADTREAILAGSTQVRVGSGLFGERVAG